jgi:RimJ/RimL family protein N-acetyltransferase
MEKTITGKNISLRLVNIEDAEFIVNLRMKKGEFLSETSPNISKQKEWLLLYKKREKLKEEFYFIIQDQHNKAVGTVRIYDFKNNLSFCWGSWIILNGSPFYYAIESALLVYETAFYHLKFQKSHFDVRKNNVSVAKFHLKMGAKIIKENEKDYFFEYNKQEYEAIKNKYIKYLET